jgi:hypothetical protein
MLIYHKKNTAFELAIPMISVAAPESFLTGETVADTAYYKDAAGAWTSLAIADTFTEIGATGMYEISLIASELNHDWVVIKCTSTNAADSFVTFKMFDVDIEDIPTAAEINAECDTALTDYDPPTKAELDAGLAALNDLDAAEVAAAVWDALVASYTDSGSTGEAIGMIDEQISVLQQNIYDYGDTNWSAGSTNNVVVSSKFIQCEDK